MPPFLKPRKPAPRARRDGMRGRAGSRGTRGSRSQCRSLLLVPLIIPLFDLALGQEDIGVTPKDTTERQAYDLLTEGFGVGYNGPLLIASTLDPVAQPSAKYTKKYDRATALQKQLEREQKRLQAQADELRAQQAELERQQAALERRGAALQQRKSELEREETRLARARRSCGERPTPGSTGRADRGASGVHPGAGAVRPAARSTITTNPNRRAGSALRLARLESREATPVLGLAPLKARARSLIGQAESLLARAEQLRAQGDALQAQADALQAKRTSCRPRATSCRHKATS